VRSRAVLPDARILLDLPGNKIRIANLCNPIRFEVGDVFEMSSEQLSYPDFFSHLHVGDKITANDAIYVFEVISLRKSSARFRSLSTGLLTNGKGLHIAGIHGGMPFLFESDLAFMKVATELKIDYLGLSFIRNVDDVQQAKAVLQKLDNKYIQIISKIETSSAVANLTDIFDEADIILIDRGDLSCDVGMLEMPRHQDYIIKMARRAGKSIFLATQFLKNMVQFPLPSIAEEVDLYNTLKTGIQGIQLSEETAIGNYPVQCVSHVFDMYQYLVKSDQLDLLIV